MKNKDIKEQIELFLKQTGRKGIDNLLKYMDKIGFYTAPASTKYHGAAAGQLAVHSLNVFIAAIDLAVAWCGDLWLEANIDSIIICALLHDLGKTGQFNKPLYIPNDVATPYKYNKDLLTLDHEVGSVIEIQKYITLTEDEQQVIAWHNGLYGIFADRIKGRETPLYMIIHFADMWASRVMESKEG